MYCILFWFLSRFIYFCHLLKQCRAIEILVLSSFFEQMTFEQMTLLRLYIQILLSCSNFLGESNHCKIFRHFSLFLIFDEIEWRTQECKMFRWNFKYELNIKQKVSYSQFCICFILLIYPVLCKDKMLFEQLYILV